jgi:hypothetical protein
VALLILIACSVPDAITVSLSNTPWKDVTVPIVPCQLAGNQRLLRFSGTFGVQWRGFTAEQLIELLDSKDGPLNPHWTPSLLHSVCNPLRTVLNPNARPDLNSMSDVLNRKSISELHGYPQRAHTHTHTHTHTKHLNQQGGTSTPLFQYLIFGDYK